MTTASEIIQAAADGIQQLGAPGLAWEDVDPLVQKMFLEDGKAAVLAFLVKTERDVTQGLIEAAIASLGSDDGRSAPEIASDVWAAAVRALRAEIEGA